MGYGNKGVYPKKLLGTWKILEDKSQVFGSFLIFLQSETKPHTQ